MGLALKSICPGLMDELNAVANNPNRSELDIARVLKNAHSLKASAPGDYFMIEGMCESLKGRADLVRVAFEKAVALSGWNACLASNYAISLHEAGDVEQTWVVVEKGLKDFASDPDFLMEALTVLINTGAFDGAAQVEQRLTQMKVIEAEGWADFVAAVEDGGISISLVGDVVRTAIAGVRQSVLARPTTFFSFTSGARATDLHLAYGLSVPLSATRVHALEMKVIEDIYAAVDAAESERSPGEPSVLDFISFHMRSEEQGNAEKLHAA